MSRRTVRLCLVALVLVSFLSAGGLSASPAKKSVAPSQYISSFWSLLACSVFGEETCALVSTYDFSDIGCHIDPHGVCQVEPASDIGCNIDPHGGGCLH
jgi:hypothetical protein